MTENEKRYLEQPAQVNPVEGLGKQVAAMQAIELFQKQGCCGMQKLRHGLRHLPVFPVGKRPKTAANTKVFAVLTCIKFLPAGNFFSQQSNPIGILGEKIPV